MASTRVAYFPSSGMPGTGLDYWTSRFVFERALGVVYFIAFVCAANQFVPLAGERGLVSITTFVRTVPFREAPSLFYLWPTDAALRAVAWIGMALSAAAIWGIGDRSAAASAGVWAALWILYLSIVNVGQVFYGFGWESMLLEAGFFTIFLGSRSAAPSIAIVWLLRWILFRDMFGAGLIKMRGDACWRDLTCLDYYFETQPIPNAVSWYFHWLPHAVHRGGVIFNHVAELGVPFLFFAPQPLAAIAGLATIAFQLTLIISGNLSWLNWLTIVLCIPTLDDRWWSWLPVVRPVLSEPGAAQQAITYVVTAIAVLMSIGPVVNMLSPNQMMNASFNPLHLVNTYGAFGSITRERYEIVVEGTDAETLTPSTVWRPYEFKGKPSDTAARPRQIAPYHLRIDWLMWFAAMGPPPESPWFGVLLERLLEGDRATLALLGDNPFPDQPPKYVRALYYRYRFTTPDERKATGQWWHRDLLGAYVPPVAKKD